MTTVGGNNVSYSGSYYYEAQIVYTLTYPSDSEAKITWERRVYHSTSLYDSTNSAGGSGDLGGTNSYGSKSYSSSSGGYKSYESGTKTVTRQYGAVVVIEDTFWIEDLADNSGGGGRSTANATINVAARPYAKPNAPTALAASSISYTTATASWTQPSNWGGNDTDDYTLQVATNSGFTAGLVTHTVLNATSKALTGLVAGTTYYMRVRGDNTAGAGAWSATVSFQATPYNVPTAPSGVTASRVSDTQITVAWTRNATSSGPYTTQNVQRQTDGGSWTTIASGISGTATSNSDTSASANHKYTYRVTATNASGTSGAGTSSAVYTTPGAPTGAAAAKDSSNNIVITWTKTVNYSEHTVEVEESQNGGAYALLGSAPSNATSYTHTAPSLSVTHRYRVRTKTSSGTALYSGYSTTGTVQLAAPPAAPTNLSPTSVAFDAATSKTFTWVHNPTDTAPQSAYELQYRVVGAGSWTTTGKVTSPASSAVFPEGTFANGNNYEWQVRTWATHADASPYSATATFVTSAPPVVTIDLPLEGSTLVTSTATVEWTFFDPEGTAQSGWTARLVHDGVVIETKSGTDAATTTTFATPILDTLTYTIEVQARDGSGTLSLWSAVTFDVNYLPPANITMTAVYDEATGTVLLSLLADDPEDGVTVEAVSATIERRIDNGPWVVIARDVAASGSVLDTQPGIHNTNEYRVTAHSAIPSSAVMDPTVTVVTTERNRGFISTGDNFEYVLVMECEIGVGASNARDKTLHHFAGRPYPLEFSGTARTAVVSVSGTVTGGSSPVEEWEALSYTTQIVLWRDPSGRHVYGSLGPVDTALVSMAFPDVWTVGFEVTEVDYAG